VEWSYNDDAIIALASMTYVLKPNIFELNPMDGKKSIIFSAKTLV
jgi:hypothetical protein